MNTVEYIKRFTALVKASIKMHSGSVKKSDNSEEYIRAYLTCLIKVCKIIEVVEKILLEEETLARYKKG